MMMALGGACRWSLELELWSQVCVTPLQVEVPPNLEVPTNAQMPFQATKSNEVPPSRQPVSSFGPHVDNACDQIGVYIVFMDRSLWDKYTTSFSSDLQAYYLAVSIPSETCRR